MRPTIIVVFITLAIAGAGPAAAQTSPLLSGDGKRIAVNSGFTDAGGGLSQTSICPVHEGESCEVFSYSGMGEGWDPAADTRTRDRLQKRLDDGGFKPVKEVALHTIVEPETDFEPIRVKRRHVKVKSGEWTIEVRGVRRFAVSLRGAGRVARGAVACEPGGAKVTGAVTSAIVVADGERVALWVQLECSHGSVSGQSWERVTLRESRTGKTAP